jgi:LEA14-like dessication related protein
MKTRQLVAVLLAAAGTAACASLKTPTLAVEKVEKPRLGITGAKLNVVFAVRNPNPEDLVVEKMDFELKLNGNRVGRGYVTETVRLAGFGRERVRSEVDVSWLALPGAVKEAVEDDRAKAEVRGHFYVRQDNGNTKKLAFSSSAQADLNRRD